MPRRKKTQLSPEEELLKILEKNLPKPQAIPQSIDELPLEPLSRRIQFLLNIIKFPKNKTTTMHLIMYDIENNKVRNKIAKYLVKKGCIRIQKSVYVIDAPASTISEISRTLTIIQQAYENNDSIIILPITRDLMKIAEFIGKEIYLNHLSDPNATFFV